MCTDLHPFAMGVSPGSDNYVFQGDGRWLAPLRSLRHGGWAHLPGNELVDWYVAHTPTNSPGTRGCSPLCMCNARPRTHAKHSSHPLHSTFFTRESRQQTDCVDYAWAESVPWEQCCTCGGGIRTRESDPGDDGDDGGTNATNATNATAATPLTCWDMSPYAVGVSLASPNYVQLAGGRWTAPLRSLRLGGWAHLPGYESVDW